MDRKLFTLAFPELKPSDALWIDQSRQNNGPDIAPHFTIAFGISSISENEYLSHIEAIAHKTNRIEFCCRRTIVGTDYVDNSSYSFLVPDEGNSSIFNLYDDIYTGPLASYLKLEIPFIPHITLGRFNNLIQAKKFCDDLNTRHISVTGGLEHLTIVAVEDGSVSNIAQFPLNKANASAGSIRPS